MFKRKNNITIVQWIFIYLGISIFILISLFDKDVSIYNKLNLINQKNGFQYIGEHYDFYKEKYNIIDFKCSEKNDFMPPSPMLNQNINDFISLTFRLNNEIETNEWILKHPKSYLLIDKILNNINDFDKISNLCTKVDDKEEFVLFHIFNTLNKEVNQKINDFNDNKIFNCKTTNNSNVRVSKNLSYNVNKNDKNVYYFYKNKSFYNVNFCEKVVK